MSQSDVEGPVRQGPWGKMLFGMGGGGKKNLIKNSPFVWVIIGVVILLWLATGVYTVGPGEFGVVRQFGRFTAQTGPGLNYRLPWPIQALDIVNVSKVRRAEIGFRTVEAPGSPTEQVRVRDEAMMLTSDKNIANVQVLILYQVKDARKYLFGSEDPKRFLGVNTEIALRSIVGGMNIDDIMTVGRPQVEYGTWEFLQRLMDDHDTGLHVVGVELQVVDPPDEVREAFYDVVRAKADEERLKRDAEGYALNAVPRARGDATRIIQAATAYREERILIAEGEANMFLAILTEYRLSPEITRKRLHLETIENVLARANKFIIDPQVGGNINPLLPLADFGFRGREAEND